MIKYLLARNSYVSSIWSLIFDTDETQICSAHQTPFCDVDVAKFHCFVAAPQKQKQKVKYEKIFTECVTDGSIRVKGQRKPVVSLV
jgi:hypothetical protein